MKLDQVCSPFLSSYMATRFGVVDVTETKASCHNCLCSREDRGDLPYYRPNLKCCTFQPFLPNYAVGALLKSSSVSDSIKHILRDKINSLQYALPLGIFVPVNYQVAFNHRESEDFGNRSDFLCPYFDKGMNQCGIWHHRGAVCTSYFCASDRGELGLEFWQRLGDYLHVCEMVLAQDALVSMGLPPEIIDGQLEYINCDTGTTEELASASMGRPLYNYFWKDWNHSPEEFYQLCCDYVAQLTPKDLKNLLSEEVSDHEEALSAILIQWNP